MGAGELSPPREVCDNVERGRVGRWMPEPSEEDDMERRALTLPVLSGVGAYMGVMAHKEPTFDDERFGLISWSPFHNDASESLEVPDAEWGPDERCRDMCC